jgi:NAD(P)-dependent dehydrogenase (short-subunit alcohol dehydrogenase family)
MDLRYQLALVTGAGSGVGREVAVALSRVGAAVLAVDADGDAAEETARLVREARVAAWSMRAGTDDLDLGLVAGRARDLGGADVLVNPAGGWATLTRLFLDGVAHRRGRRTSPAVVNLGPAAAREELCATAAPTSAARISAVVLDADPPADLPRRVLDLLREGEAGTVVED